jgi:hypothetical protein
MTQVPPTHCPHCGATNPYGAAFCESCGKALPPVVPTGPRVLTGDAIASTAAGQQLQAEQLHKQARRARGALLALAILATIGAGLFFVLIPAVQNNSNAPEARSLTQSIAIGTAIIAVVFWGLYIWSRSQPLPAAIVGLVVFVTLKVINFVMMMSAAGQDGTRVQSPIGCIDIIIIAVLVQAITAGVQHRKLLRQQQQQAAGPATY